MNDYYGWWADGDRDITEDGCDTHITEDGNGLGNGFPEGFGNDRGFTGGTGWGDGYPFGYGMNIEEEGDGSGDGDSDNGGEGEGNPRLMRYIRG